MLEEEDPTDLGFHVKFSADHVHGMERGRSAFELGFLIGFIEVEVNGKPGYLFVAFGGKGAIHVR